MTLMKIISVCIALLVIFMGLSACKGGKEMKIYADDNGREIVCRPGDVILLSLEANPTTGYDWEIIEPLDSTVIQIGEREFSQSSTDKKLVGAGGVDRWRIKAVQRGRVHLELVYRRPWEKTAEPIDRFSLDIVVR